ncbi:MAG: polysaccharide deacetylase family protein [Phycisphaerales bacterium]|nr:MAG: polysaccharide deacetylase family protein [Phycisphaerales bacterium]
MKGTGISTWLSTVLALLLMFGAAAQGTEGDGAIKLIVRADDIGSSHAANLACIQSYREGIVRSVEVMVPCPWFNEAAQMLRANPGYDVGVHLTLTSEWANYKWGPLTQAPSLVDKNGHFFPTTSQRSNFPPNTGFLESKWNIHEVEKELRAQIELAVREIPQVTHLSSHMGTPSSTPELRALVQKLAKEYKLPVETPGAKYFRWGVGNDATAAQREAALIKALEALTPGIYILVEHPGLDTEEMRAIGHEGYWNVAAHRDAVTKAFTSKKVKATIEKKGIQLVSYNDVWPTR